VERTPSLQERVGISKTAVIVVDMQNDFVDPDGANSRWWRRRASAEPTDLSGMTRLQGQVVTAIDRLVASARVAGVPVIWARTVNSAQTNARFWLSENQVLCQAGSWGCEIIGQLTPAERELVVTKTRHSAFFATPLDSILRRGQIETVVVAGTATHGCVEATVRDAMTLDYWAVVLGDCCGQADHPAHEQALVRMDRLFGIATDSPRVIAAWQGTLRTAHGRPAGGRRRPGADTMTSGAGRPKVVYLVVCGAPRAARAGELVERLSAAGWTTCVIASPQAVKFIDVARLERLTGYPVRSAYKDPGTPDLLPPPDALVVCPATFNSVNKAALGVSDTLALGLITGALGAGLPLVIAPALSAHQAAHPAFTRSVETLRSAGATVIYGDGAYTPVMPGESETGYRWETVLEALASASTSGAQASRRTLPSSDLAMASTVTNRRGTL